MMTLKFGPSVGRNVSVDDCLCMCGPVKDWKLVQGVPGLSPNDSWDKLQPRKWMDEQLPGSGLEWTLWYVLYFPWMCIRIRYLLLCIRNIIEKPLLVYIIETVHILKYNAMGKHKKITHFGLHFIHAVILATQKCLKMISFPNMGAETKSLVFIQHI